MAEMVASDPDPAAAAAEAAAEAEAEAAREATAELNYENGIHVIEETLCVECGGGDGTTRLMLTPVNGFRSLILQSFECPDCDFTNNDAQFGGEYAEKGVRIELTVNTKEDLDRQLIKSEHGTVFIPSLDFEIPAKTQSGTMTTVEGVISKAAAALSELQPSRKHLDPPLHDKLEVVIGNLRSLARGDADALPFKMVVDDIAGNSHVENPSAPASDPALRVSHYARTPSDDLRIGLQPTEAARAAGTVDDVDPAQRAKAAGDAIKDGMAALMAKADAQAAAKAAGGGGDSDGESPTDVGKYESLSFASPCPNCSQMGAELMCTADIPLFKEVIIMAFNCEHCGYKSNEVKGGGAVTDKGTRVTLRVDGPEDYKRDVLKGDTAGVSIPELELELEPGSLGGMYTTVEGLLAKLREKWSATNPFTGGDSTSNHHSTKGGADGDETPTARRMREFSAALAQVADGTYPTPFTLVLNDPLGNSFVGPRIADLSALDHFGDAAVPDAEAAKRKGDVRLAVEHYTRSWDEDEQLGLHDIDVGEQYAVAVACDGDGNARQAAGHGMQHDHPLGLQRGDEDAANRVAALARREE